MNLQKLALASSALAVALSAAVGTGLPFLPALSLGWYPGAACDDAEAQNPGGDGCRYDARERACADSVDNDSDERADCADQDCSGDAACRVAPRCPRSETDANGDCGPDGPDDPCADGYDGDGDGFQDGCDLECPAGANGYCRQEDCAVEGDEDGDGAWDNCDLDCLGAPLGGCPDGSGADSSSRSNTPRGGGKNACVPSAEICGNGADEDCDGYDVVCQCPWWQLWGCGEKKVPAEDCGNGADDDGDGWADCADAKCGEDEACAGPAEDCGDGVDNDGDGWADCWDSECSSGTCATFPGLGEPGWPADPARPGGDPRNPSSPTNPGDVNPKGRDSGGKPIDTGHVCAFCEYEKTRVKEYSTGRSVTMDSDIWPASQTECEEWLLASECPDAASCKSAPLTVRDHYRLVTLETTEGPEPFGYALDRRCYENNTPSFPGQQCSTVETKTATHDSSTVAGNPVCVEAYYDLCLSGQVGSLNHTSYSCETGKSYQEVSQKIADFVTRQSAEGNRVSVSVTMFESVVVGGNPNIAAKITVTAFPEDECVWTTLDDCDEKESTPCLGPSRAEDPKPTGHCTDDGAAVCVWPGGNIESDPHVRVMTCEGGVGDGTTPTGVWRVGGRTTD